MEKKKYDLCLEVLRRMEGAGILDKVMIVGSWCVVLYEDYFAGKAVLPAIIDICISNAIYYGILKGGCRSETKRISENVGTTATQSRCIA